MIADKIPKSSPLVFDHGPQTWQELQAMVGQFFSECGCDVEVEKKTDLVRGAKKIDVYVDDNWITPRSTYICECKFWQDPVPQEIVHAFRTVLHDLGANRGFIISKAGFQAGCRDAARNTNIELLTFEELQAQFFERWLEALSDRFVPYADRLFPYWDPTGGRRPQIPWGDAERERHHVITEAYRPLIQLGTMKRYLASGSIFPLELPKLAKNGTVVGKIALTTYREYFDFLDEHKYEALRQFQIVHGEIADDHTTQES